MYCINCGNKINPNLKYCNSCGGRIENSARENRGFRGENTKSIAFFGIAGIIGCFLLVKTLLDSVIDPGAIVMIIFAYLATIFGISYLLIKHHSGNVGPPEPNREISSDIPRALKTAETNRLDAPVNAPASVVEDTTRTLDKVPADRR